MGQNDGHDAFVLQVMETVQQKREISGGFGCHTVIFEAHILANGFSGSSGS